jgi:peptidoglycan/xylan/chitin deacetylase (PgdA/CDA1 family)
MLLCKLKVGVSTIRRFWLAVLVCLVVLFSGWIHLIYSWGIEDPEVVRMVMNVEPGSNLITRVDTGGKKVVALTFDDGPDIFYTPRILDVLREHQVKATFFVVGENVEANPELLRQMVREGHQVENHTHTHPELVKKGGSRIDEEIYRCEKAVESLTGRKTQYFRPPKRLFNDDVVDIAAVRGYTTVLWTVGVENRTTRVPQEMARRVSHRVVPGAIILAHDGRLDRSKTVEALPLLIKGCQQQGYRLVTLDELLSEGRR